MKAPAGIESLTLQKPHARIIGGYPPLGFMALNDAELGNGDHYGLYWPYGREVREPIICDMLHDEARLQIAFSSASMFLEWLDLNDGERGDEEVDDPALVTSRFLQVRIKLHQSPEENVPRLQEICADFPECSEYWFTLAGQLRRLGDIDGCGRAAVQAFTSNWVFGMPPNGALRLLQNAPLPDDPLVARSKDLSLTFGGTKENPTYTILQECIADYLSAGDPLKAILLDQNYGYLMRMETVAFQERYGFVPAEWAEKHSALCQQHLGDSRLSLS